jgi:hypothetical protein
MAYPVFTAGNQGRASKIMLKGVSVARLNWPKPPAVISSFSRASPAF